MFTETAYNNTSWFPYNVSKMLFSYSVKGYLQNSLTRIRKLYNSTPFIKHNYLKKLVRNI